MPRRAFARRFVCGLLLFAACAIGTPPREARAFHGHHGHHGAGWHGGFGFGHCGFSPWGGGFGWGGGSWGLPCWPLIGNVSYGTGFAVGGTRFWSGTTVFGVPAFGGWGGCGPVWGAPVCWGAPAWGGCGGWGWGGPGWAGGAWGGPGWIGGGWGGARWGGVGAWYGGWNPGPAWGWNRGPAWGWNRGPAPGWAIPFANAAPINRLPVRSPFDRGAFGAPAFGLAAIQGPRTTRGSLTVRPPAPAGIDDAPVGRGHLGAPAIDAAVEVAIRTSNAPARARAARLVALGDRHLRAAVDEPAKLAKAIDAYRRAASIAPDQPDTFLRQAIAFTAAGKDTAAATAVGRAVAIDPRLAEEGGLEKGPGAPAFVPVVAAEASPLLARSGKLLTRIFTTPDGDAASPADNWIAHRWLGRDAGPVMVAARP